MPHFPVCYQVGTPTIYLLKVLQMDKILLERDYEAYPAEALELLLGFEAFQDLREPLQQYIENLRKAGVSENVIAIVGHAIHSHLLILQEQNNEHYANFLLPSRIDPYETIHPEDEFNRSLLAIWEKHHTERNQLRAIQIAREIQENNVSVKGKTWIFQGPMYSEKTAEILEIIKQLYDMPRQSKPIKIHAFISDAVEESTIMSRKGGRGRDSAGSVYQETRRIENVQKINLASLLEALSEVSPGELVVIDEVSFLAWAPEECAQLYAKINELNARGVNVLVAGLDASYRGEEFPFIVGLGSSPITSAEILKCTAYYAVQTTAGLLHGGEATSTFRIDLTGGFGDFLLPVVIGRNQAHLVQYPVMPAEANPFISLRENDPETYNRLISVGENEELFQYYRNTVPEPEA